MPGDPRQCRQQAVECARLAQTLASPEARDTFSDLARSWLKLAVDLERSQVFLEEFDAMEALADHKPQPSRSGWLRRRP